MTWPAEDLTLPADAMRWGWDDAPTDGPPIETSCAFPPSRQLLNDVDLMTIPDLA
jgi:hypothetical protein